MKQITQRKNNRSGFTSSQSTTGNYFLLGRKLDKIPQNTKVSAGNFQIPLYM